MLLLHTWDGQDAGGKVPRFEELVHNEVRPVCGAVPDLQVAGEWLCSVGSAS